MEVAWPTPLILASRNRCPASACSRSCELDHDRYLAAGKTHWLSGLAQKKRTHYMYLFPKSWLVHELRKREDRQMVGNLGRSFRPSSLTSSKYTLSYQRSSPMSSKYTLGHPPLTNLANRTSKTPPTGPHGTPTLTEGCVRKIKSCKAPRSFCTSTTAIPANRAFAQRKVQSVLHFCGAGVQVSLYFLLGKRSPPTKRVGPIKQATTQKEPDDVRAALIDGKPTAKQVGKRLGSCGGESVKYVRVFRSSARKMRPNDANMFSI